MMKNTEVNQSEAMENEFILTADATQSCEMSQYQVSEELKSSHNPFIFGMMGEGKTTYMEQEQEGETNEKI